MATFFRTNKPCFDYEYDMICTAIEMMAEMLMDLDPNEEADKPSIEAATQDLKDLLFLKFAYDTQVELFDHDLWAKVKENIPSQGDDADPLDSVELRNPAMGAMH